MHLKPVDIDALRCQIGKKLKKVKICTGSQKLRELFQKPASRPRPRALLSLWWLFRMYADQHTYLRGQRRVSNAEMVKSYDSEVREAKSSCLMWFLGMLAASLWMSLSLRVSPF